METSVGMCCCLRKTVRCPKCAASPNVDLSAALSELGSLNIKNTCGARDPPMPGLSQRRMRSAGSCFEQSPPPWTSSPSTDTPSLFGLPICIEPEQSREVPLQPPNSPVSPKLPFEHFRSRDGSEPLPQRCEWDGRLIGGRRLNFKGRQRMLSGPQSSTSSGLCDRSSFLDRLRDRSGWRPYRIPRPKLLNMGQSTRVRTISATMHDEAAENRLTPIIETSPVATSADGRRCLGIEEGLSKTSLDNGDCSLNFPRSRSAENLERRALDVAPTALDSVSDKIEKLHVT